MLSFNVVLAIAAFGLASSVTAQNIQDASAIILEHVAGADDYSIDQVAQIVRDNINPVSLVMFNCGSDAYTGNEFTAVAAVFDTEVQDGLTFDGPEIHDPVTGSTRINYVTTFSPVDSILETIRLSGGACELA